MWINHWGSAYLNQCSTAGLTKTGLYAPVLGKVYKISCCFFDWFSLWVMVLSFVPRFVVLNNVRQQHNHEIKVFSVNKYNISSLLSFKRVEGLLEVLCSQEWISSADLSLNFFMLQQVPDWYIKHHGIYYPVCGVVHIKDPLVLIGKNSPWSIS